MSVIATAAVTWGTVYITHRLQTAREIRVREREKRQEVLSILMGSRRFVAQLYISRFEALIYSDDHEARWRLAGYPPDSLDLREAMRWMHKSEELALEIARATQRLFETVGWARILFLPSTELTTLTDAVYRHSVPIVDSGKPKTFTKTDQLDEWKGKALEQLKKIVDQDISQPLQRLIDHLASELQSDS